MKFKTLISLFFCLFLSKSIISQIWTDVNLESQEDVDEFGANNPNVTFIYGNLNIEGYSVKDLTPLMSLTDVRGSLTLDAYYLESLDGLQNLESCKSLKIIDCERLINLVGLQSLTECDIIDISRCDRLESLDGLQNFTRCKALNISRCDELSSIVGLQNLTQCEFIDIEHCDNLINVEGLQNLTSCKEIEINWCDRLESIDGLQNLTNCENLEIGWCDNLKRFAEFSNLQTINELKLRSLEVLDCTDLSVCTILKAANDIDWWNNTCSLNEAIALSCPDIDGDNYNLFDDCDDTNPEVNPGLIEVVNNAIDENCDGIIEYDMDGDGYSTLLDCDDNDSAINTSADEVLNNTIDENCDGIVEYDMDGDGFSNLYDCDDHNPNVFPGAEEIDNNGIDENCDDIEGGCVDYTAFYNYQNTVSDLVRIDGDNFAFCAYEGLNSRLRIVDGNGFLKLEKEILGKVINLRSDGKEVFIHTKSNGIYSTVVFDAKGNEISNFLSSPAFIDDKFAEFSKYTCITIGGVVNEIPRSQLFGDGGSSFYSTSSVVPGGFKLSNGAYLIYLNSPSDCNVPADEHLGVIGGPGSYSLENFIDAETYYQDPNFVNSELFKVNDNHDDKDFFYFRDHLYQYDENGISFISEYDTPFLNEIFIYDDDIYTFSWDGVKIEKLSSIGSIEEIDLQAPGFSKMLVSKNKFLALRRNSNEQFSVIRFYIEDGHLCESDINTIDTTLCSMAIFENDTLFESGIYFSELENTAYNVQISKFIQYDEIYFCEGYATSYNGTVIETAGVYDFNSETEGCDTIFRVKANYYDVPIIDTTVNINCFENAYFGDVLLESKGIYTITIPDSINCDAKYRVNAISEYPYYLNTDTISIVVCYGENELTYRDSTYQLNFTVDNISENFIKSYYASNEDDCDTLYSNIVIKKLPIIQVDESYNLGELVTNENASFPSFTFVGDTTIVETDCEDFTYTYNYYENYNLWTIPIDDALEFGINDVNSILVSTKNNSCLGYDADELKWETNIANQYASTWLASEIKFNSEHAYYLGDDLQIYSIDFPLGEISNENLNLSNKFSEQSGYIDWDIYYDGESALTSAFYIKTEVFHGNPGQAHEEDHYYLRLTNGFSVVDTFVYNDYTAYDPLKIESFDKDGVYYLHNDSKSMIFGTNFKTFYTNNFHCPAMVYDEKDHKIFINDLNIFCYADDVEGQLNMNDALWMNPGNYFFQHSQLELFDSILIVDNFLMFNKANGLYLGMLDPIRLDEIHEIEFTTNNKIILRGNQSNQQFIIKENWNPIFEEEILLEYGDDSFGFSVTNDTIIFRDEPFNLGILNKQYIITMLVDNDQDGYTNDVDCDDTNPDINPGAEDIPDNGIDEDCDGEDEMLSSTNEIEQFAPKYYPNPTTGLIHIEIEEDTPYKLELFDVQGRRLEMWNDLRSNTSIDLKNRTNGVYILKYTSKELGRPYLMKVFKI